MAISLNPGFVLIALAFAMLALPKMARAWVMALGAILSLWLLLDREFGAASAVAQMGLAVVLLDLDALNRVFGIAFLLGLVLIAIYSGARRNRYEDAAIMTLAGGSVSALFVGDLVSFVASISLAGFAAAWVVFAGRRPRASGSGVRLLVWCGLEALLLLGGVAFTIASDAPNSVFEQMKVTSLGGGFIFAALMIRVAAPLAHVWLKDSVSHASSTGAVALSVFPAMLGLYALARLFPAEPLLIPVGAAMIVVGLLYASADNDLRRAAAYGQCAQIGICVALIGVGSPLARAGSEAHAFALVLAFALLQMAFGAVLERRGNVDASSFAGVAQAQPLSTAFILVGGLAAGAAPGFATYISLSVLLEASSVWEHRVLWSAITLACGALVAVLAVRPVVLAAQKTHTPSSFSEAPFPMLLAMGLSSFFLLAIGLNPAWLYQLTPAELAYAPYDLSEVAPHFALIGFASSTYLALRATKLTPRERGMRLLDVDALYRGPVAGGARWVGVVLLRVYGAWQGAFLRVSTWTGAWAKRGVEAFDQPYRDQLSGAAQCVAVAALLVIIMLTQK